MGCAPAASPSRAADDAPYNTAHEDILRAAKYQASPTSPYPFYVVVLDTDGREKELPGRPGQFVSDALAALLRSQRGKTTHIVALTGGHNVTVEAAISMLCAAVAELQAHPTLHNLARDNTSFSPLFIAFAWRGIPRTFFKLESPVARAKLIRDCEKSKPDLVEAVAAAQQALRQNNASGLRFETAISQLSLTDCGAACMERRLHKIPTRFDRGFGDSRIAKVLGPLETAIISMYEGRGRIVGRTCQQIFYKFQVSSPSSKLCLISSSLGVHVFAQALAPSAGEAMEDSFYGLLQKVHCTMFVQGAAARNDFSPSGIYGRTRGAIAGAAIAVTTSSNNVLNVYDMYHKGGLIGRAGMPGAIAVEPTKIDDSGADLVDRDAWYMAEVEESESANSGSCWINSSVARLFWISVRSPVAPDEYAADFMHAHHLPMDMMLDSSLSERKSKMSISRQSLSLVRRRLSCFRSS